ncbi:MAG: PBP1A family penicillin-binding protein [Candidatus Delongbacteria bacterium]|nr:PBP1A family penicillin-binding protein [Candidatus Delongbacteria bacterium]
MIKKHFIIHSLIIFLFAAIGSLFGILYSITADIPDLVVLENIQQGEATQIYSADSVLLKEFFEERRQMVEYHEIPTTLIQAVLSIEDHRFYRHWGIDIFRTTKVIAHYITTRSKGQGGSTITQQLARNLFLTQRKTIIRKLKEMLTAVKIERIYSKNEILTMYLNNIYIGPGVYGIKAASDYYFSKPLDQLDLSQYAFLAGVIQSPGLYSPNRHPKRAYARRNLVLYFMEENGYITHSERTTAEQAPIPAISRNTQPEVGSYYIEHARRWILDNFGYDYLYRGGLKVYLSMDYQIQKLCEEKTRYYLNELQHLITPKLNLDSLSSDSIQSLDPAIQSKIIQSASYLIDPHTGYVKAMVGGRDFNLSEFNRALQAKRQPGSAFKPFLYAAAIDSGYTPASLILDQPIAVQIRENEMWIPQNYDQKVGGFITLRDALKLSKNLVSIRLIGKIKPRIVIDYAQRMGIRSPLESVASLAIGTSVVTLDELTAAYIPFATIGYRTEPIYIQKIVAPNGNVIWDKSGMEKKTLVIKPEIAYIITDMMKSVVNHGTAYSVRSWGFNYPALAGKTGTTNDYTDAWFIGYSPHYVYGVWVGLDNNKSLGAGRTGTVAALPIWIDVMKQLHAHLPVVDFPQPNHIVHRSVCAESHMLATPQCPKTYLEVFLPEFLPDPCNIHGSHHKKSERNISDFDLNQ